MILTFSSEDLVRKILNGTKKHTIRRDEKGRWEDGRRIHFWLHNPRNISKNPMQFAEGVCKRVDYIEANFGYGKIQLQDKNDIIYTLTSKEVLNEFAINDGFENYRDMKGWFIDRYNTDIFNGRIIYWDADFEIAPFYDLVERGLV